MTRNLFAISLLFINSCLLGYQSKRQQTPDGGGREEEFQQIRVLYRLADESINSNIGLAFEYAKTALAIAEKTNDDKGIVLSCNLLGRIYGYKMADYKSGILYYERSASVAEKLQEADLLAEGYFNAGILYHKLGVPVKALDLLTASVSLYKSEEALVSASIAEIYMASVYAAPGVGAYAKALTIFKNALRKAAALKDDSLYITAATHYTSALVAQAETDGVAPHLNKALSITKDKAAYADLVYQLYLNLGGLSLLRDDAKAAVTHFGTALHICRQHKIKDGEAQSLLMMGRAYVALQEFEQAEGYYTSAMQLCQQIKLRAKLAEVYGARSMLADKAGQFEKAFQQRSLQLSYTDSTYRDQNGILLEMQSAVARDKMVTIQKKDAHINTLYINMMALVLLIALFLALLYFNHQRLRSARDKATLAREKLELEKELLDKDLREEQLKQKLEVNAKALTANTLNLIQKNEILEKIKTKAEEVRQASPADLAAKIRDLVQTTNFALNIDKDWKHFKVHFEQVHNDFFDHLKTKYPHLNSGDLKLCALLKLNLDTKEIASLMNISPQSVKVARSRLRKKLSLDISSNLSSVITQM